MTLVFTTVLTSFELFSFVHETAVFEGYTKRFSTAWESYVHAIAFRVTPIDSPYCDTKPIYHGILH